MDDATTVELHTHSTASDGAFSPTELARRCARAGVDMWALTDHDNCYGCAEAAAAAEEHGIAFVPGIEMSSFAGRSVHVLGYGVDPDGAVIQEYAERRIEARRERTRTMIERLAQLGVEVEFERVVEVAGSNVLGRPHLARALVETGAVSSIDEAFDRFLHDGGPAHVHTRWPSVEEAIELIERAGGVSVLAHPGQYDLDEAIESWIEAGLDGIEVVHPSHLGADRRRYEALADRYDLLKTASSDFHGNRGYGIALGEVDFPPSWLEAFQAAVAERN
ncbi:MAG: PHP domain-containing protein [Persicimonas sp.]